MPAKRPKVRPNERNSRVVIFALLLLVGVWLVFGRTLTFDFVSYDDEKHIIENTHVNQGLSADGLRWAFSFRHDDYWHPLDYVSHMIDCNLFNLHAGGHHFSNVLFHSAVAIALFLLLHQLTGSLTRSAFAAALFALHPLRAESVAWITERKDLLSGLLFVLSIAAYAWYVRGGRTFLRYTLVVFSYALALMAKPTVMPLPFVLLLLDLWPLRSSFRASVIIDKIPLVTMSILSCLEAARDNAPSFTPAHSLPLTLQLSNALVSYGVYLLQFIWPSGLAVLYPFPLGGMPLWQVALALAVLLTMSIFAAVKRTRWPYFFVGWFWYLIMLVPVIGIYQAGDIAHADRYTYLADIGLALAVSWGVVDLASHLQTPRQAVAVGAVLILTAFAATARVQTSYWRDSEMLWHRTLAITGENDLAHRGLATVYLKRGNLDKAIDEYRAALAVRPSYYAYHGLGAAFAKQDRTTEAIDALQRATDLSPGNAEGEKNLAAALFRNGRLTEAIAHWRKCLGVEPNDAEVHANLGLALSQTAPITDAISEWERALELDSRNMSAASALAWVRATYPDSAVRDGTKAVAAAQQLISAADRPTASMLRLVAAAYAEAGRFSEAIATAERARELAEAEGNTQLVETLRRNIEQFQRSEPLRD
jgi:protein O-mannosyl-transferase